MKSARLGQIEKNSAEPGESAKGLKTEMFLERQPMERKLSNMTPPVLSKRETVALAALQGLLASGHFTLPADELENPPSAWTASAGPNVPTEHRYDIVAVDEAFRIADEFIEKTEDSDE